VEFVDQLKAVRTALYVPASNARALEKAQGLDVDMLIIDLEDSVPDEAKAMAREAAKQAAEQGFAGKLLAIRINATDSEHHSADISAMLEVRADCIVVPKVEDAEAIRYVQAVLGKPLIAMIESPAGIYMARDIACSESVSGLIVGANDICADMGIRPGPNREGLELALQSIVLAAAFAGVPAFDAVCNRLDDMTGFETECRQGRGYGFAGKTLIHPNQVAIANAAFGPSDDELAEAQALIDAATGGAQRFRGRMIEDMHVEAARRMVERAKARVS
jgi:(3S)-malyl-CoA thioesterase